MIKAILIVSSMFIDGDIRTNMPSMEKCMIAKTQILEQDPNAKVICIPHYKEDVSRKFGDMMGTMVDVIKDMESQGE